MPCFWSEKPASSDKKYETTSKPGKALSLHRHFSAREARDPSRGERAAPDARQIRGHLMNIRRPILLQQKSIGGLLAIWATARPSKL